MSSRKALKVETVTQIVTSFLEAISELVVFLGIVLVILGRGFFPFFNSNWSFSYCCW